MQLVITEKQLRRLSSQMTEKETVSEEEVDPAAAAPDAGTSSDGEKKTGATKWESGATRGPGNQIGVTKWSDVVGSTLKRGKANPLSEQAKYPKLNLNPPIQRASSDYFATVDSQNKLNVKMRMGEIKPYVYKSDDGDNLVMNLIKGEFEEALLDLRDITMSPGGMAGQTVIELVFSESVVVPVVIEALNAAVILNDLDLYRRQGDRDPEAGLRVIQDVLMYITRGAFKYAGKSLKSWLKTPAGVNFMKGVSSKMSTYIMAIKASLSKLPESGLKKFVLGKIKNLDSTLISLISNFTGKTIGMIPALYRKAVVSGLLVYVTASGIDRLLNVKPGTTKAEMAKKDGPSEEYTAKLQAVAKPNISAEDIKTADDLNILAKKGDLKKYAEETIKLYQKGYPCLGNLYKQNKFIVVASTDEKDIYKINNKEYIDDGGGAIYSTENGSTFAC